MLKTITFTSDRRFEPKKFERYQNNSEKNLADLKQGVLVNSFIQDNKRKEVQETLFIDKNSTLPKDLYTTQKEKKKRETKNLLPLLIVPNVVLGIGALLSIIYKKSIPVKEAQKLEQAKNLLPGSGKIFAMTDDNVSSLYFMVQDPNKKTAIGALAVLAGSAVAFVSKNVVDGFKEIWVRRKEADIKRNQEESLIKIETRSFEGKNKILSYLMNKTDKELKRTDKTLSFKGYDKNLFSNFNPPISFKKNEKDNKNLILAAIAAGTLITAGLLTGFIFKNLRAVAKQIQKSNDIHLTNIEKNFSKFKPNELKKELSKLKNLNPENKRRAKAVLEKLKEIPEDVQKIIDENVNEITMKAQSDYVAGNGMGVTSFVNGITVPLYMWILNKTPQTFNFMLLSTLTAAGSYIGVKSVEAVKEIQVMKENAETEVDLQDRLVEVELKNFMAKKQSFIKPLVNRYKNHTTQNKNIEELNSMKSTILDEVKNGPPFIYS